MVDKKRLLVGDIKKCTKMVDHEVNLTNGGYVESDEEIVRYNALLLQVRENVYINLEDAYVAELLSQNVIPQSNLLRLVKMTIYAAPQQQGDYFVDEKTLQTYEEYEMNNCFHDEYEQPEETKRFSL